MYIVMIYVQMLKRSTAVLFKRFGICLERLSNWTLKSERLNTFMLASKRAGVQVSLSRNRREVINELKYSVVKIKC